MFGAHSNKKASSNSEGNQILKSSGNLILSHIDFPGG